MSPEPVLVRVADLIAYDDLDARGDDGWDIEALLADARVHGIRKPLEVAHSAAQLAVGDAGLYVFNGTHRLAVARTLGLEHVYAVPAVSSEDAVWAESLFGP
jgi:hypothetical protein